MVGVTRPVFVVIDGHPAQVRLGTAVHQAPGQPVRRIQGRDETAGSGRLAPHLKAAELGQIVLWV